MGSTNQHNKLTFRKWVIPLLWNGAQAGMILGIAFFVFEITQSWVDNGISKELERWVLPVSVSIAASVVLAMALLIFNIWKAISNPERLGHTVPPAENLATSILEYGIQLHEEARDRALVNLRNNFTHTLHVLGFYKVRTELGEVALRSAVILRDDVAKTEILIDDLGWAHYLLGNTKIAMSNITRGVEIAKEAQESAEPTNLLRLALAQAKGLRHLALILHKEANAEATQKLEQALNLLTEIRKKYATAEVERDIAQIFHAKALVAAMYLDIHKTGKIREGDIEGIQTIDTALTQVRQAASMFKNIGDLERYTKALFLEVRLLEAKGAETEAREISAIRDRTLAESEWVRLEATKTITGV